MNPSLVIFKDNVHLWAVVVSDNMLIYYPIITWNIMAAEIGQYLHVAVGHILLYNIC